MAVYASRRDVIHNYSKEADYNVKLVITDTFGCTDFYLYALMA